MPTLANLDTLDIFMPLPICANYSFLNIVQKDIRLLSTKSKLK